MRLLNDLLDLFFPRLCFVCGICLDRDEYDVCNKCCDALPRISKYASENLHKKLVISNFYPVKTASLYRFMSQNAVSKLIYPFKYYGNRKLAFNMGKRLASTIEADDDYKKADFLVPIPIHPRRKRKRGYNQSEYICRGISSIWNIPVRPNAVKRMVNTKSQTRQSHWERKRNVKNIFALDKIEDLSGKHIILVDDVFTTGSTISSCAECLFQLPDVKISVLTLAATRRF
jgi:ComF family protein